MRPALRLEGRRAGLMLTGVEELPAVGFDVVTDLGPA